MLALINYSYDMICIVFQVFVRVSVKMVECVLTGIPVFVPKTLTETDANSVSQVEYQKLFYGKYGKSVCCFPIKYFLKFDSVIHNRVFYEFRF